MTADRPASRVHGDDNVAVRLLDAYTERGDFP